MSDRRLYSPEELRRAIELHDVHGLTWPVIAERLNRNQASLESQVSRFRSGKWKGHFYHSSGRLPGFERMLADGWSVASMAAEWGITPAAAQMWCLRRGFDAETRALYQERPWPIPPQLPPRGPGGRFLPMLVTGVTGRRHVGVRAASEPENPPHLQRPPGSPPAAAA